MDRFKTLLLSFGAAPWTLQRLCELVLEPRKQYTQLHKVRGIWSMGRGGERQYRQLHTAMGSTFS